MVAHAKPGFDTTIVCGAAIAVIAPIVVSFPTVAKKREEVFVEED